MLDVQHANVYTDFNGLAKLKTGAREKTPEAIKEVAKQFESIFLNRVLKTMRQAKLADGILDSTQSEFYREMYDQQLAIHLSGDPGIGLASLIVKQLSPEKEDHEGKLGIDDYLNRSVGTANVTTTRQSKVSSKNNDSVEIDSSKTTNEQPISVKEKRPLNSKDQLIKKSFPLSNKDQFVKQLRPFAENAAKELGVDAKVILAQAALETGWGKSVIKNSDGESSFNLFNIKANKSWKGKQAKVATLEYHGGIVKKEMAGFRSYSSYGESFKDYVNFIKSNPRYSKALNVATKPQQYMRELQYAGYATDPNYASKVMKIYQSDSLASGDKLFLLAKNDAG